MGSGAGILQLDPKIEGEEEGGLPLGLSLPGHWPPGHRHIIPERWACVIDVKKKK